VLSVWTTTRGDHRLPRRSPTATRGPAIRTESAGQEPAPHIWLEVVEAMREVDEATM